MEVAELVILAVKLYEARRKKKSFLESEKCGWVTPSMTSRKTGMAYSTTALLSLWSFVVWWINSFNIQIQDLDEDALLGWLCSGMTGSFWKRKASKGDGRNF